MTWDYEWGFSSKENCRGKTCYPPFYDGESEPDVTTHAAVCKLKYGQTCVKYVIYDRYDKKKPTFVARYCGRGQIANDGSRPTTSCHVDRRRNEIVEVCFCDDKDKCNSGKSIELSLMTTTFLLTISILILK
jgi:hypothetical protein